MPNTYSQIYLHYVFSPKNRQALISAEFEQELYKYITGIVKNLDQQLIRINGMPDHLHIFIGLKPNCRLSDLVREIKKSSNAFIKERKFTRLKFEWQEGYGAFSYSHSNIGNVIKYISNQKEHHKKRTFKEEYLDFLKKLEVEYNDVYLFEFDQ